MTKKLSKAEKDHRAKERSIKNHPAIETGLDDVIVAGVLTGDMKPFGNIEGLTGCAISNPTPGMWKEDTAIVDNPVDLCKIGLKLWEASTGKNANTDEGMKKYNKYERHIESCNKCHKYKNKEEYIKSRLNGGITITGEFTGVEKGDTISVGPPKPHPIYQRIIHFNGMDFHFAVNEEKKIVHGWVDHMIKVEGDIDWDSDNPMFSSKTSTKITISSIRHDATVHCDSTDYFYPLFGISVCLMKLLHKIEQSGHKKKQPWNDYKRWLNNGGK